MNPNPEDADVVNRSWTIAGRAVALAALALALAACRMPYIPMVTSPPPAAYARMVDSTGRAVGLAVFLQQGGGVRILMDLNGVKPGTHGVHIHEVGRCDAPTFESAGAHFNPTKAEHGTSNPKGPHAGDLPNVVVDSTGKGHLEATSTRLNLDKSTLIFDGDGSSIVVHEDPDDNRTDPAGGSGARVSCGVLVKGS